MRQPDWERSRLNIPELTHDGESQSISNSNYSHIKDSLVQQRMAGDDFITECEVDGAVLRRQREEHRVRDDALHPTNDPDGDDRKPEAEKNQRFRFFNQGRFNANFFFLF